MNEMLGDARRIAEYLSRFLTKEGVIDPEDGCIYQHAYTTEFFAWLCAILFVHTDDDRWLTYAETATSASLELNKRQTRKAPAAQKYHWEFKNLALLYTEQLIGNQLPRDLQVGIGNVLYTWNDWNLDSANWTAMRMLNYELRYRRFGRIRDKARSKLEQEILLDLQTPEGFFPDRSNSYSLQYHAYILAILALHFTQTQNEAIWESLNRGAEFIRHFIDPDGEFNYYGRGQRQLFGYGSLILAFSILSDFHNRHGQFNPYGELANRIYKYVRRFRKPGGVYPIVLNKAGKPYGWYDYNLAGDYLAFLWVFLSLSSDKVPVDQMIVLEQGRSVFLFPEAGFVVVKRPDLHAVIALKGREAAEPLGLVHLWPASSSCFGGPDIHSALARIDYSLNYIGPLIKNKPILQKCKGEVKVNRDEIILLYSFPDCSIEQAFKFYPEIKLTYKLNPIRKPLQIVPLSVVMSPGIVSDFRLSFQGDVPSVTGWKHRESTGEIKISGPITYSIHWSKFSTGEEDPLIPEMGFLKKFNSWQAVQLKLAKLIWILWVWSQGLLARVNTQVKIESYQL